MSFDLAEKNILISGGTSGLGKAIAMQFSFSSNQLHVLGGSFHEMHLPGIKYQACDYSSLKSVLNFVDRLTINKTKVDILVNNAGILSPPVFEETNDGFEKSYQVNFLAHVLLTRLLLKYDILRNPVVVNISSPMQARGTLSGYFTDITRYSVMQAYANSKLYQALFSEKLAEEGIKGFAFDPGTFSSGIYRSQKSWFQHMYKLAAPFMVSAEKVAAIMIEVLKVDRYTIGSIVNKRGRSTTISRFDENEKRRFWKKVDRQLHDYLQ